MKFIKTNIEGVVIIEPDLFSDDRGYFYESFSQREFAERSCDTVFVQDNEVWSSKGVIRGLHFQMPPNAQGKLIRAVKGIVLDVAVDIRKGSPTFGMHVAVELSDQNRRQLFVPRGFAHGYSVLSDQALVLYKCDNFYSPQSERGIRFDDPTLGIEWGIPFGSAILSDRDRELPLLKDSELFDFKDKLY